MTDPWLPTRLRRTATIIKGERALERVVRAALGDLAGYCRRALDSSSMDASVLSSQHPEWQRIVDEDIMPAVETVFASAYDAETRTVTAAVALGEPEYDGSSIADMYAGRYLTGARNRMVGVSDTVFAKIAATLQEGREAVYTLPDGQEVMGESIPLLAQRVDGLLTDDQWWKNRATVVARTEVISANNAGARASAAYNAEVLGVDESLVVKEWLATADGRTRETHLDADGQQVLGIDTPFVVGGYDLQEPGDPDGPAEEVIQCRCTALYHYPGDAAYPDDVVVAAASRATPGPSATLTAAPPRQETQMAETDEEPTGVIIAALPAADDPVHGIGPEEKHATLLSFGDPEDNPGLTDEARSVLAEACANVLPDFAPAEAAVVGVEPLGDDGAWVWMLADGTFADLRAALLAQPGIQDLYEAVEQFTPHVTIGYEAGNETGDPDNDADLDEPDDAMDLTDDNLDEARQVEAITFDRLAVWWGTSRSEFPLGGEAPEEEPMDASQQTDVAAGVLDAFARHIAGPDAEPGRMAEVLTSLQETFAQVHAQFAVPEPGEAPAGGPALAQDIAPDGPTFYGIIWPEGVQSGDARAVDVTATDWRDLPLPLMAQDAQAPGHNGAVRVGRIDVLERDETTYAVPVIRYSGTWDTSDAAIETARQVDQRIVRGISVDGDAVTVELRGSDGRALDPMVDDFPEDGVVVEVATAARVSGGTVCSIPAFHQAYIANGTLTDRTDPEPGWNDDGTPKDNLIGETPEGTDAPVEDPDAVAASAWTLVASADAMPVWSSGDFANPGLTEPTRLTVTDDGLVFGHLAVWGTCHIGIDGICQEPPASATNYAYFATGSVPVEDGMYMPVGQLTMETGHAAMNLRHRAAAAHYDNTGTAVAYVAMGQDGIGIWFAGRLAPGVTDQQVFAMRAAGSVSGDWREIGGGLELIAGLVVNVPGFPIPSASIAASGDHASAMVASGVVHPQNAHTAPGAPGTGTPGLGSTPADLDALEANLTRLERRNRARAVQARVREQRAATARRRLRASIETENRNRVAAAAARLRKV